MTHKIAFIRELDDNKEGGNMADTGTWTVFECPDCGKEQPIQVGKEKYPLRPNMENEKLVICNCPCGFVRYGAWESIKRIMGWTPEFHTTQS